MAPFRIMLRTHTRLKFLVISQAARRGGDRRLISALSPPHNSARLGGFLGASIFETARLKDFASAIESQTGNDAHEEVHSKINARPQLR